MTDLIACVAPGDELALFGNLLLSRPAGSFDVVAAFAHPFVPQRREGEGRLAAACAAAGARRARLLPFAHLPQDRIDPEILAEHLGPLDDYGRVYTPSIQDPNPLAARLTAAAGLLREEVWTLAGGGVVDEIVAADGGAFQRRLTLLAAHYPELLVHGRVEARRLRNVDLYRRHRGPDLQRYLCGYQEWRIGRFDYRRPWHLEDSPYEWRRHEAELEVLAGFPWRTLVEVGACEGGFSERLCHRFPERRLVAYEPDPHFFATLAARVGHRAEVRRGDAEAAGEESCDVLMMSSAIYYLGRMPYRMLRSAERVLVSHAEPYHVGGLDAVMRARGFELERQVQVPPCIEPMEGVLEIKYGSDIKLWRRGA